METTRELHYLTKPVFIVGFMGAGKTSVARRLARTSGVASVDMDTYIERQEGKRVRDIFAEIGEDGFRDIETRVLKDLVALDPLLISCGGGIVMRPENRELLKQNGYVVYLRITAEQAAERIKNTAFRPMFRDLENARNLTALRLPLYEEIASCTIDTGNQSLPAVVREVRDVLEKEGILCLQQK